MDIDPENDVFGKFKRVYNVSLPSYLENLLRFTGFDNVLSLSTLDEKDISEIEDTARTKIQDLFPHNTASYLGHFKSAPPKFCILPGQKNILLKIKELCFALLWNINCSRSSCATGSLEVEIQDYSRKKLQRQLAIAITITNG